MVEENLVAFLRAGDIVRIGEQNMLSSATITNPYFPAVQKAVSTGGPLVAISWRFYLYWFAEVQERIETGLLDVRALLRSAEGRWKVLEDADVLMDEPRNDGHWLRPWRRAIAEFQR